ncbi:aminotransferase class IV [Streptomyces marincola]|uniref:aminotransferase class IV n=1 Tax=Streptomyces marincola TaxID=2878388 RepID=UPI0034CF3D40
MRVFTPELSGSLLPGITRDSVLQVARDLGHEVEERRVSVDEWKKAALSGELTDVFACGTAAVITPVGHVKHATGAFGINGNEPGPLAMALRERLCAVRRCRGGLARLDAPDSVRPTGRCGAPARRWVPRVSAVVRAADGR